MINMPEGRGTIKAISPYGLIISGIIKNGKEDWLNLDKYNYSGPALKTFVKGDSVWFAQAESSPFIVDLKKIDDLQIVPASEFKPEVREIHLTNESIKGLALESTFKYIEFNKTDAITLTKVFELAKEFEKYIRGEV